MQCMKIETVSQIGPVRIPKSYKEGLDQLKAGKVHVTYSSLMRDAIYLLLVKEGLIADERLYTQKNITEDELMMNQLSYLSGLSTSLVAKKIRDHTWQLDAILDFYREHRRFPPPND